MGIDALDIYGLSEVMGRESRAECVESKDGPVMWEDHFYPEVIDPQSTPVLPEAARRACDYVAHQRGTADHPLSHP